MAINFNAKTVTTTPYTVTNDDEVILSEVTSTSSVVLPSLPTSGKGRAYYIKDSLGNSKTNPIIITAPSGKTIDGAQFAILNTPYARVFLVYDGVNWKSLAG